MCKIENSNTAFIITNSSVLFNEDIEMQQMNINSIPLITPSTWQILHMPPDCCPRLISKHFSWCGKCIPKTVQRRWTYLRTSAHWLVEHRYFEWLIIGSILASSSTLVRILRNFLNEIILILCSITGFRRYKYTTTTYIP